MADEDQCRSAAIRLGEEEVDKRFSIVRIQGGRWFVSNDQSRRTEKGAYGGDTLLLPNAEICDPPRFKTAVVNAHAAQ